MNLARAGEGLTHDDFKERLRESEPARRLIAGLLILQGATELQIDEPRIAPTYEERGSYIDRGDLYARFIGETQLHRYEVKRLSVSFSGLEDWPFKGTIFVDEVDGWERKQPKPRGYFSVDHEMTAAIWLPCSHPEEWWVKKVYDKHYRTQVEFYATSVRRCRAYRLPRPPIEDHG